jgi:hypothetical protein
MKILDVAADWSPGYANPPSIKVAVDECPSKDELIYDTFEVSHSGSIFDADQTNIVGTKTTHAGTMIVAEKDGYISYRFHDPKNERGALGGSFKLSSGEEKIFKGCWSSNHGALNKLSILPYEVIDVSYMTPKYNNVLLAGAIRKDKLLASMDVLAPELELITYKIGSDKFYTVRHIDHKPKEVDPSWYNEQEIPKTQDWYKKVYK